MDARKKYVDDHELAVQIKNMIEKVNPSDPEANMRLVNEIYAKVHSLQSMRIAAYNANQPKTRNADLIG